MEIDIFKIANDFANKFGMEVKIPQIANEQLNGFNILSESNTPES